MSTLTREALLAMPADQYMSETQLKFFETLLQSELEEARQRHHDARETMQPPQHRGHLRLGKFRRRAHQRAASGRAQ